MSEEIGGIEGFFIRILIKSPKEDRIGNEMSLEVFVNNTFLCLVRAMKKCMRGKCRLNLKSHNMPFFSRKDNSGYTGNYFNKHLTTLTANVTLNTNLSKTYENILQGRWLSTPTVTWTKHLKIPVSSQLQDLITGFYFRCSK